MRRLTLAALFGAILLSACSDESRESPLEPNAGGPAQVVEPTAIPCPPPRFPVVSIATDIKRVFPRGPLLVEALAREAIIAVLWTKCRPAKAQEAVASFVGFTLRNFQAGRIGAGRPPTSTPQKVSDLIDAMLAAVLLSPQNLPLEDLGDADLGSGFADGVSPGRVTFRSTSGTAGGSWQGNAWGEPSVVTFFRLPDDSNALQTEGEEKFAPFWDFNVSNASNNHIAVNGELFVGICQDDLFTYPVTVEIGHNPVQINGPLGLPSGLPFFEILLRLTEAEYLGLTICPDLVNPAFEETGLNFGEGLPGFASSAWSLAAHRLMPLAQMILPGRVHAVAPKNTGAGGRTTTYSPFGMVQPLAGDLNRFGVTDDPGSEEDPDYFVNEIFDTCSDGCNPRLQLQDSEGQPLNSDSPVTITVSLVKLDGATGNLLGDTDTTVTSVPLSGGGFEFLPIEWDLAVSEPGSYHLRFSATGFQTFTGDIFNVYRLAFTKQPGNHAAGALLGETAPAISDFPVVQLSALDAADDVVTTVNGIDIVVEIGTDPGGETGLGGTREATMTSGVANFTATFFSGGETDGLNIDVTGIGFTLEARRQFSASAVGFSQATSAPFNIFSP